MPSSDTFSIQPIRSFIDRWLTPVAISVDPFARNSMLATYRNDLNPDTAAEFHLDAAEFCHGLGGSRPFADVVLFDPPYSPRQMSEVYHAVGKRGMESTQNARLYKEVRDELDRILKPGGIALSFGWNSAGFGNGRGYEMAEVLLVAHGGAHNDTICVAERKHA